VAPRDRWENQGLLLNERRFLLSPAISRRGWRASRRARMPGTVRVWLGTADLPHVIDGSLRLEDAPGHTPGSSIIRLRSGGDRALFAADILHTPLQLAYPAYSSCFCTDPARARETRTALLGWAADTSALVLPAHFSGHSALEIERRGTAFAVRAWASFPRY
jgi:glyoxylase-like metal-dependent hydrolase (beta-lactamase superfamily II)